MNNNLIWHTEKRKVKDLIPFEGNPRKLTAKQAAELRHSLQKFDLVEIPAINLDNKIIAGHQRVDILLSLGRGDEEIDVRVPNRLLDQEEFIEYGLRSNLNTGDWDWHKVLKLPEPLLLDVGFDKSELMKLRELNIEKNPEIKFSEELLLEHNYVILYFSDPLDWNVAKEKFGLGKVKDLLVRKAQPVGIGRVINGKDWLHRIQ